jgi:hypothetical protein
LLEKFWINILKILVKLFSKSWEMLTQHLIKNFEKTIGPKNVDNIF